MAWMLCCAAAGAALAAVTTDGVLIIGIARASRVRLGQAVVVTGTLVNERAGKIALGVTDPLGGFRVQIRDANGKLVPPNASGKGLIALVHRSKQQLAPGEQIQQSIWISSLFNLVRPGKYRIRMSHDVPRADGIGTETVRSSEFTVEIVR